MLVGYNNNVTYKGKVYHVQTEDSGLNNPIIVTLLYIKGTILASKKTSYSHLIGIKDIKKSPRIINNCIPKIDFFSFNIDSHLSAFFEVNAITKEAMNARTPI